MAMMKCILGIVVLLTVSVWTEAAVLKNVQSVSEILAQANKNLSDSNFILDGDIMVPRRVRRNADPCIYTSCKWPQASNGNVYIPYSLSSSYSFASRSVIRKAMKSFSKSTCIRFYTRTNKKNYLNILPNKGCSSYVGRQGGAQDLSLDEPHCINHGAVQHELLHALGFHHEHERSDRDHYIRVLWENIETGRGNFQRENTLNQQTPYDYSSVMHYNSKGFSRNNNPVLEMVPRPAREFGMATEMSQSDIQRVNRVYCSKTNTETSF